MDLSLGALLEHIVSCGFRGEAPFAAAEIAQVRDLARIYGLDSAWQAPEGGEPAAPGKDPARA
jgi:hypothetical protein